MSKPVILTGLRTNAEYHLGNYIGAILPIVHMAQRNAGQYQINMFAPDLHSFTTPIDHARLYAQTMQNIKVFLACGLPLHENVLLYRQSFVPAHSELTVILNNFSYFGELSRMTEFKDKTLRLIEQSDAVDFTNPEEILQKKIEKASVTAGLFDYPVLMAADILLYNAEWVPVGEDQRQHLEFARNLAIRLNNKFEQDLFVVPKTLQEQQTFVNRDAAPRIRSLRDPAHKMSKSVSDPAGTIQLSDTPEQVTKKIMGATTDSVGAVHLDWDNQPGISNLLQILALLSEQPLADVAKQWEGNQRYGDLKKATAEVVVARLDQIQHSMTAISDQDVLSALEHGEHAAAAIAQATLLRVQRAVGLR